MSKCNKYEYLQENVSRNKKTGRCKYTINLHTQYAINTALNSNHTDLHYTKFIHYIQNCTCYFYTGFLITDSSFDRVFFFLPLIHPIAHLLSPLSLFRYITSAKTRKLLVHAPFGRSPFYMKQYTIAREKNLQSITLPSFFSSSWLFLAHSHFDADMNSSTAWSGSFDQSFLP